MPWHESQLAGTLIGTTLGFLLAFIPSTLERRRARKCLLLLLKAEVHSIVVQLKDKLDDFRSTLAAASNGESCEIFISDRRIDEVFTANLVNMTSLQTQHAEAIFGFYQTVGRHRGLIKALSQDKLSEGDDGAEFCKELSQVIVLMEDSISRGNQLFSTLK